MKKIKFLSVILVFLLISTGILTGCSSEKENVKDLEVKDEAENGSLIESNDINFYKYKSNEDVSFDIDGDGNEDSIRFDTENGKLLIEGYDSIDIDIESPFIETTFFTIIKYSDETELKMNMIGILDYGPSSDYVSSLFSLVDFEGEKSFVQVGDISGEIVDPAKYDENSMDDFNYRAFVVGEKGIEAPVRLSVLAPQTWFGRTIITFDGKKFRYGDSYITSINLTAAGELNVYAKKDLNSDCLAIKSGEKVHILETDNSEWIKVKNDSDVEGWINLGEVSEESFTDYKVFD